MERDEGGRTARGTARPGAKCAREKQQHKAFSAAGRLEAFNGQIGLLTGVLADIIRIARPLPPPYEARQGNS